MSASNRVDQIDGNLGGRYAALSPRGKNCVRGIFAGAAIGAMLYVAVCSYNRAEKAEEEVEQARQANIETITDIVDKYRLFGLDMDLEKILAAEKPSLALQAEYDRVLKERADELMESLNANPEMMNMILKDHVENPTQGSQALPIPTNDK